MDLTLQGPLQDPATVAAMQAYTVKAVVGFVLFVGLLYWWVNR